MKRPCNSPQCLIDTYEGFLVKVTTAGRDGDPDAEAVFNVKKNVIKSAETERRDRIRGTIEDAVSCLLLGSLSRQGNKSNSVWSGFVLMVER